MSKQTIVAVRLQGEDAAKHAQLAPGDNLPESIYAEIALREGETGAPSTTLVVYWRGTHPDGAPHRRRSSAHYTLTKAWAAVLIGSAAPPRMTSRLP